MTIDVFRIERKVYVVYLLYFIGSDHCKHSWLIKIDLIPLYMVPMNFTVHWT